MILFLLPAALSIAAIGVACFYDVDLRDHGTQLLGMIVGLALTYGHRFLRPIGIDFAAVSKYVGWGMVIVFSVWLAFPKFIPWN